jgi:inner membrane protein involved in colicin E2 resistance
MGRINDVGGMQGFPPVQQEVDEPAFHADWEAHVFALNRALSCRAGHPFLPATRKATSG